jgi:hypothetical protein
MTQRCIARLAAAAALLTAATLTAPASAQIRFEEVTTAAGMTGGGSTYGASWGDFNGDGLPDLWVGNHDSEPSLYLNDGAGRFVNVVDRVWSADPRADTHGAQWADFDNDGDQDLVEVVGALENPDGSLCLGCGRNHLFVNEGGRLHERAREYGLDASGFARSPLWFDADGDGRLDLLVANTRQGESGSVLYLQGADGRFVAADADSGFRDARWSRRDEYWGRLMKALALDFEPIGLLHTRLHLESAQLAGLTDDGSLALALVSAPSRVFAAGRMPLEDVTATVGFPDLDLVNDVAAEDFDGDGLTDLYVSRGPYLASDVAQPSPTELWATLIGGARNPHSVSFRAEGPVTFELHPTFLMTREIFVGASGTHPRERTFTLDPADPAVHGPVPSIVAREGGVAIVHDRDVGTWTVFDASLAPLVDVVIRSGSPIESVTTDGFARFREEGRDALLLRRGQALIPHALPDAAGEDSSCFSVAAGDFDNDMDVDLYLVCTGPLLNVPNRLLRNDGNGGMARVPDAGGAGGSASGRGDVVAMADYDGDGFLDLFVTNGMDPTSPFVAAGPHQLFRNQGNDNHWLQIDLQGSASNRDAIGATVTVEAGGVRQLREQRGGMHRAAQNFQRLHFGLGSNTRVDRLTVRWPDGSTQTHDDLEANRILLIRQDGEVAAVKPQFEALPAAAPAPM